MRARRSEGTGSRSENTFYLDVLALGRPRFTLVRYPQSGRGCSTEIVHGARSTGLVHASGTADPTTRVNRHTYWSVTFLNGTRTLQRPRAIHVKIAARETCVSIARSTGKIASWARWFFKKSSRTPIFGGGFA